VITKPGAKGKLNMNGTLFHVIVIRAGQNGLKAAKRTLKDTPPLK